MNPAPDLTTQAPRSPHERIGGYAILGRTLDKCRASISGTIGEYHFDCPLDNFLFGFKNVTGDDFKKEVEAGASDEAMVEWLNENGDAKTPQEVAAWSESVIAMRPSEDPERKAWFAEQCTPLGLDPIKTTLFEWLDEDDRVTHGK